MTDRLAGVKIQMAPNSGEGSIRGRIDELMGDFKQLRMVANASYISKDNDNYILVVFDKEYRTDDAEDCIAVIRTLFPGVGLAYVNLTPIIANFEHYISKGTAFIEIRGDIIELINNRFSERVDKPYEVMACIETMRCVDNALQDLRDKMEGKK